MTAFFLMMSIESKIKTYSQPVRIGYSFSDSNYDLFKRKAFTTTDNELSDIATAANIGVSNKPVSG